MRFDALALISCRYLIAPEQKERPILASLHRQGFDHESFKSMISTDYLIFIDSYVILISNATHPMARGRVTGHVQSFPAGIASPEKELYDPRTQKSIRADNSSL
jgi:hypothetical protein